VQSAYTWKDPESYNKALQEKIREREERVEQERRQAEYEKLKDCTFQPKLKEWQPA